MLLGLLVCDSFGSQVSLRDGVARWDESILFSLGPLALPPVASTGIFVGVSLVFILLSVSGFHPLPSPFRLDLFLSFSVVGSCSLHLFFFFFVFRLPGLLLLLILSSVFLSGILCDFLPLLGFLPSGSLP